MRRVDPQGVVDELTKARRRDDSALAFDADGTLWSGDVGEDVFSFACDEGLLRTDALGALLAVGREHQLDVRGTPADVARGLFAAYRAGVLEELRACEVMTWGYAGLTVDELRSVVRAALRARGLEGRARHQLARVFEHARTEGLRVVVVSASPHVVVEEALAIAGIRVDALAAAHAEVGEDGRIRPALRGAVPYGPEKPVAGNRLLAGHDWLGSFGDNAFDVEMLRAARIGVAVCPKPALLARLPELPDVLVLD